MATNLIVTVSKSAIHSLAHQGILVHESFHQIRDLVRSRLGDAYALLFAEPSPSRDGSSIDWYTPVQGTAKRLVDLPEEEQRAARAATLRMAQDIARIAVELKQSGIAPQVTRGTILELALQYPDEKHIYVVGEQPLFTCWGFGPGTPGVQPQDLTRLGQVVAPPKAPPPTVPTAAPTVAPAAQPLAAEKRRGGISWLWLLPLLLLLLLVFLLTASFGGNAPLIPIPGFNFTCPALPFPNKAPISLAEGEKKPSAEAEKLLAEIQDLEKKSRALAEQCPPESAPSGTGAALDSAKAPSAEAEKLRAEIRDLEKKLHALAVQCPPEAAPPVRETLPDQKKEALVIPEKPSDMDFLRGRWLCDRGLYSKADGQPIILLYDFDSNGKGTATVRQQGREDCIGPAVASMNAQGILIIEAERQICPNGRSYSAETIECRGDVANRAMCRGKSGAGTDWGESVPFYKRD